MVQLVKKPPAMCETWVWSLGWEDPLEREMLPIPVFWPGEFQGLYSPWGSKELDMTEWLSLHFTIAKKKKKRWNNSKPKVHSNNPKSCPPLSQISLVCVWMVKTESSHWKAQVLAPSDLDFSPSPATFSPCDLGMFTYSV